MSCRTTLLIAGLLAFTGIAVGAAAQAPDSEYDAAALRAADLLEARYLFPDRGRQYAELLRRNVEAGRYAQSTGPEAFAQRVTTDLNELAEDRHLRISGPGGPAPGRRVIRRNPGDSSNAGARAARARGTPTESPGPAERRDPGGAMPEPVSESGWLNDEVAFMRIGLMPDDPELQRWAAEFMEEHAAAEALILDLRICRGGTIGMMNAFLPYLYGEETHLVTMDMRIGADEGTTLRFDDLPELRRVDAGQGLARWEHWVTPSDVANKPEMPVYVLTGFTGSACEHLTMALKVTRRATVIGDTTGGAGHFATFVDLPGGYSMMLPIGRTYDPRTGDGWELTGIEPHVRVDPAYAEARALELFESSRR